MQYEDSFDQESEADSINENPIIFDHLFTPKSKDTESNLTHKKLSNEKMHGNETIENLQSSVLNMNVEMMELKSFVKDELYSLSKNVDQIRTE